MKRNIPRARFEKVSRSLLRLHRVAVVRMENDDQYLIDWRDVRAIAPSRQVMGALCDISHRWVIYIGAFCLDAQGKCYMKSTEIAPEGMFKSETLADALEHCYRELLDGCNPNHLVGSGWIAVPGGKGLDEEQAARIFEACGAWQVREVAA
ncbi:hypothetical protein BSR09_00715 [Stutzerimonas degradans]|nr:hypothetical protein BSR09_00715 [Stutzerimonas degradans]